MWRVDSENIYLRVIGTLKKTHLFHALESKVDLSAVLTWIKPSQEYTIILKSNSDTTSSLNQRLHLYLCLSNIHTFPVYFECVDHWKISTGGQPVCSFFQCKFLPTIFSPEASMYQNAKPTCLKLMFYTFP